MTTKLPGRPKGSLTVGGPREGAGPDPARGVGVKRGRHAQGQAKTPDSFPGEPGPAPTPPPGRKAYTDAISEDERRSGALVLARLYGLRTAHFRPALTAKGWRTPVAGDGKGWPDLIIVGRRLIIRELKTDRGRVHPDQAAWLAVLQAAGVDAGVWRVGDWLDGTIRDELGRLRQ